MPDVDYHGWTHAPAAQGGTDPIPGAGGSGDGLQFNSGIYGSANVGDWLLVETQDVAGATPNGYQTEFAVGRHGMAIHPIAGISVSLDPILYVYGTNDDAAMGLQIDLDTLASGNGVTGEEMSVAGGGGGSVVGADWSLSGGGGGSMEGLNLFITNSGSASTRGVYLEIAANTSDSMGFRMLLDGTTPVGAQWTVQSHSGDAQGLLLEVGGVGGSTVKALEIDAYSGTTNFAIYVNTGECHMGLPTVAGTAGTLWNDSGTVKVA